MGAGRARAGGRARRRSRSQDVARGAPGRSARPSGRPALVLKPNASPAPDEAEASEDGGGQPLSPGGGRRKRRRRAPAAPAAEDAGVLAHPIARKRRRRRAENGEAARPRRRRAAGSPPGQEEGEEPEDLSGDAQEAPPESEADATPAPGAGADDDDPRRRAPGVAEEAEDGAEDVEEEAQPEESLEADEPPVQPDVSAHRTASPNQRRGGGKRRRRDKRDVVEALDAETLAALRELVRGVYAKKNPRKVNEVGELFEKYAGVEYQMYKKVCKKYGCKAKKIEKVRALGEPRNGQQRTGFARKAGMPKPPATLAPAPPGGPPLLAGRPGGGGSSSGASRRGESVDGGESDASGWPFVGEAYSPNTEDSSSDVPDGYMDGASDFACGNIFSCGAMGDLGNFRSPFDAPADPARAQPPALGPPMGLAPLALPGAAPWRPLGTADRGADIYGDLAPAGGAVGSAWADSMPTPAQPPAGRGPRPQPSGGAGEGPVRLDTFIGRWRDSMGNIVQVDWARPGSRGGQLDVTLSKPRGGPSSAPIRLNVKSVGSGRFVCGHYDLDAQRSGWSKVVWADHRAPGKTSVWERLALGGD